MKLFAHNYASHYLDNDFNLLDGWQHEVMPQIKLLISFLTKTLALRIQGFEDEQTVKRFEAIMSDPDLLEQLPSGFPAVVKLLRLILGK